MAGFLAEKIPFLKKTTFLTFNIRFYNLFFALYSYRLFMLRYICTKRCMFILIMIIIVIVSNNNLTTNQNI